MNNQPIREALFLVGKGIPFDVAFKLDDIKRKAFVITLQELNSDLTYDFVAKKFSERPKNEAI